MCSTGTRPRLLISHGPKKKIHLEPDPHLGNLTPDVQTDTFPAPFVASPDPAKDEVLKLGKYLLFKQNEKSDVYQALDTATQEDLTCKVVPVGDYRESLSPYWQVDDHPNVSSPRQIVVGQSKAYVLFPRGHGDLHAHVRLRKRLREDEASRLFRQIVAAVQHCHDNGVILRDLKLRKFVFQDAQRTTLHLEGLEDAVVLAEEDADNDVLKDKHGCPAYVSPEILSSSEENGYSGKAADVWSLGVMLYTMLVGRYPFHDPQPLALFGKIRRGQFHLPESLSPKARCLIKCLLRRDPGERLRSGEILSHPWFRSVPSLRRLPNNGQQSRLQVVPDGIVPSLLSASASASASSKESHKVQLPTGQ